MLVLSMRTRSLSHGNPHTNPSVRRNPGNGQLNAINTRARGDVQRLMIGSAPGDIADALGYVESAQMFSFRRENPHPARARAIDIAFLIDLHSVWISRSWIGSGIKQEL